MADSGYINPENDGYAGHDQVVARARDLLLNADSFVLVTGTVAKEDSQGDFMGYDMNTLSVVKTFPPIFLAEVARLVAGLPVQAMIDLDQIDDEDEPPA